MGADVEVGISGRGEEWGEDGEDDVSVRPQLGADDGVVESCLCEQFQRNSFCRRLAEEAHVECRWMTFLKELFYHLFFPLSLPIMYWCEGGMNGIINRQYWGSGLAITQWMLAFAFYAMNILAAFFVVPDIVIANLLIIMRHMVLATKYGFYTKTDMAEMRHKILSHEALDDRTLFIAWTNPMPLRILKRQLLLAAARNNLLKCTQSLRVVPGASRNTVKEIMHQLTHEEPRKSWRGPSLPIGRAGACKLRRLTKVNVVDCANCVKNSCTDRELENRWVQICLSQLHDDPRCHLPESSDISSEEDSRPGSLVKEANDTDLDSVSLKKEKIMNDLVDLPALMLAAHLLQQSGYLLSKKKFGHQLLKSPKRVWLASICVAIVHTAIPYVVRGITETPFVWGGDVWYVHVANICSILLNFHAMSSSVSFMVAGVADFRRRYFSARLLNSLLKDGCIGQETLSEGVKAEMYTRVKTLKEAFLGQQDFRPQDVEAEMFARELKRQHERKKSDYHTGVAVDYGYACSILGWWAMRVLVLDFGLVFSRRVKYYASYFCIYCGVVMAFLLIVLFTKGTKDSAYIMGVVTFDLIVFIGLLALIVFPGGETNKMHLGHGATLVYKKMELATKLRGPLDGVPPKQREAYAFALEVMGTVSEALAWDNTITKVTILGFKAGSEVITALLGFGGAAIGIIAQQFTSYIGSSNP
ncbi:hypothetical protein M758_5G054600 [Ceratodon purpureus]|uniref:Uncharacterized protein n=1 Tax=Ceratodon purpureus TaxID=3225 RepID=A0A8T0HY58_CERPU|nr:hypothetical protein KC19_5G055000 [Ceratodon purpureus]KAG0615600.1 hypothetical protein M758_5G054600 [Ceratodon purpureus]